MWCSLREYGARALEGARFFDSNEEMWRKWGDLTHTAEWLVLSHGIMNNFKLTGCKQISVPSKAPMSDTKLSNLGTALAIMYATMTVPPVQDNQVTQCVTVLAVRCLDPRKMRMKTYLAGI